MPVVINEFEVVADQQDRHGNGGGNGQAPDASASPPAALEPGALGNAVRTLERQALRVWAH